MARQKYKFPDRATAERRVDTLAQENGWLKWLVSQLLKNKITWHIYRGDGHNTLKVGTYYESRGHGWLAVIVQDNPTWAHKDIHVVQLYDFLYAAEWDYIRLPWGLTEEELQPLRRMVL
jgi:hypothetical protein